MMKNILTLLFPIILLLTNYQGFASEMTVPELLTSSYQTNLLQGISESFNLEEDVADASLKKAVELEPDNPMGYAMEAMLHLLAYDMCFSLEQRQKEKEKIFHYSEEAIVRGEKRIAGFPKDTQASLAVALAKITKVYWAVKEKHYFVLAQETSNIWHYLEAAKSIDPDNHDIDFLMGLLHYHIDHYAGMTGFLSSLLITKGNRQKGLQELQIATQQGYLLRDIAQVELAAVYLNYEKQPSKALPIILQLKRKFPNNYSFSFSHCVALLELRRIAEAEAIAAQIEMNIRLGTPPYVPQLQTRYYQLMGRIHFNRAEYGRAESYFHKAILDKSFYNMRTTARSLLYLGMIHDIRQERKYAQDYYRRVLKTEGAEGAAQIEARQFLKTPYRVNENLR